MGKYTLDYLPTEILSKIALDHKKLRKNLKLSQKKMAARTGISLGSLKRFENTGQISLASFLKLLQIHNRLNNFATIFETDTTQEKIDQLFSDKTRK